MTELVTDEMIDSFAIHAPPKDLGDEILAKYGGVADLVQLQFDGNDY